MRYKRAGKNCPSLEDYVEQPAVEIARVLTFIGVEDMFATDLAGLVQRPDSLGRWRRELEVELAAKMLSVGSAELSQFGYED